MANSVLKKRNCTVAEKDWKVNEVRCFLLRGLCSEQVSYVSTFMFHVHFDNTPILKPLLITCPPNTIQVIVQTFIDPIKKKKKMILTLTKKIKVNGRTKQRWPIKLKEVSMCQ